VAGGPPLIFFRLNHFDWPASCQRFRLGWPVEKSSPATPQVRLRKRDFFIERRDQRSVTTVLQYPSHIKGTSEYLDSYSHS
jgi:hypothetical protein